MLADECISIGMLAESVDSWSDDDDGPTIGDGHTGSIDGFVSDPCLFVLGRIHPNDQFLGGSIESKAIDFGRQFPGLEKHRVVVSDKDSSHDGACIRGRFDDGQNVEDWERS